MGSLNQKFRATSVVKVEVVQIVAQAPGFAPFLQRATNRLLAARTLTGKFIQVNVLGVIGCKIAVVQRRV